jgi:hypothetical protein
MTSSKTTDSRKSPAGCHSLLAVFAGLLLHATGFAATVPDLYAAQVPVAESSGAALDDAFSRALAEVMVKLTGQRNPLADPAVRKMIGSATPLVSQYQVAGDGLLRVQFDSQALHRRLDAARLPVWADERPETLVMLPGEEAPAPDATANDVQLVLATAASRGLPVTVLRSSAGAAGSAEDPLTVAQAEAARVGAELILIGRRVPVSGVAAWRWTLLDGTERSEWQGDATQGIQHVADQLASRYAVAAAASSRLRLEVQGVSSFSDYGRLQDYLRGVGVIETLSITSLQGDTILYDLVVRGGVSQLRDALALKSVLLPQSLPADGRSVGAADLVYRIANAP